MIYMVLASLLWAATSAVVNVLDILFFSLFAFRFVSCPYQIVGAVKLSLSLRECMCVLFESSCRCDLRTKDRMLDLQEENEK
jgi:hypothetical protein